MRLKDGFGPICPVKRKLMSTSSFSRVTLTQDCRSWACENCGQEMADLLLADFLTATNDEVELFVRCCRSGMRTSSGRVLGHARYRKSGGNYFCVSGCVRSGDVRRESAVAR